MKKEKFKIILGKPRYGWSGVRIENPTNKKRPVFIDHSFAFPMFQDFDDVLRDLRFKRKTEILIEEEGPETLISFYNLGNEIKVTFKKFCRASSKKKYNYYFKPFTVVFNKKEFINSYIEIVYKHLFKYKSEYTKDHYFSYYYDHICLRDCKKFRR